VAHDSAATRTRLLDAAYTEFAEHGLAGARVDRIAAVAGSNKQSIYAHFGSKQALFDQVMADRLELAGNAVPFTVEDLPGYAVAVFDYLLQDPGLLRLARWKALERGETWNDEIEAYRPKIWAITDTYRFPAGTDPPGAAAELLSQLLSTAVAGLSRSPALASFDPLPAEQARQRQRAVVATSATAIVAALTVS
jgi:AcrR family transcriptional regulator